MSTASTSGTSLVVAVDGPSGSGKSTVSRAVATKLGLRYLDTGAMYRAATWQVLADGVDPTDHAAVTDRVLRAAFTVGVDPAAPWVAVDGRRLDAQLRDEPVSRSVSAVAAVPRVRERLIGLQRNLIANAPAGIVAEGRDIGSVVAPDAPVKVFLTASDAVRIARRTAQSDAEAARHDVVARDVRDHQTTPLEPAADAVVLDTTAMSLDQAIATVLRLCVAATARSAVGPTSGAR